MKIIVALDFKSKKEAFKLVEMLNPEIFALKVGFEMFVAYGPEFVRELIKKKYKVFLDLKFHDIPQTVANACKRAAELGVWMLNVHAQGGIDMLISAKKALEEFGNDKPLLIAVSILTSFNEDDFEGGKEAFHQRLHELCDMTQLAQLDGVVCSALDVSFIKNRYGKEFITVTPGIRNIADNKNDQKRVVTARQAIDMGSDYLVIGRSITQAKEPANVIQQLQDIVS